MIEQHNSLAEKFLKKGFWLYLFSFIIGPIWYITKIILSNDLSVWEIWTLYWTISLITMLSAYNDLWMTQSTLYFIPRYVNQNRYNKVKSILVYSLIVKIITWILISCFFYFWAEFISNNYFQTSQGINSLKIFSFYFIWINLFQIFTTFFLAIQNTFWNRLLEFLRKLFTLISALFIFFWKYGNLENYSYSWIVWLYIWILIWFIIFYKNYQKKYFSKEKIIWSKKLFKEIFSYSIISFLWTQWATILSQIDMQMIIYLLWTKDAWYYTNYLTIISMPLIFMIPIFNLLPSAFSEFDWKKEYAKIINTKNFFSKYFFIIGFLLSIIFFIYSKEITYIFFWEKFLTSWIILKYSIFFIVFNILLQINFHLLWAIWKVKDRTRIIYSAIFINIITNYIFIKSLWVSWAALATGLWWLIIFIISEYKTPKKYKWNIDNNFILKNITIFSVIWYIINKFNFIEYNSFTKIELFLLIALIWFSLFVIFLILNIKDTKTLIHNIKNKWK